MWVGILGMNPKYIFPKAIATVESTSGKFRLGKRIHLKSMLEYI